MIARNYYFEIPTLYDSSQLGNYREIIETMIRKAEGSIQLSQLAAQVRERKIDLLALDAVMKSLREEKIVHVSPEFLVTLTKNGSLSPRPPLQLIPA